MTMITRREAISAGLASLSGLLLPGCSTPLPPTYGNILRMGDNLIYAAHRSLLPGQTLAREYTFKDISSFPATGTLDPAKYNDSYDLLRKGSFTHWKLSIEGLVAKPGFFTLTDLQSFQARRQITRHTCEEGWTAIAEWTGVELRKVLNAAGMLPSARYVQFYAFDGYVDSIDMIDALHPQTILAYGMNGKPLPIPHGAPVRLRIENQLGYKSMKFLQRVVVSDALDDKGDNGNLQNGWAWYVGM